MLVVREWQEEVLGFFGLGFVDFVVFFRILKALLSRWRSSTVEQLICNQQVGGSSPSASSDRFAHPQTAEGFIAC